MAGLKQLTLTGSRVDEFEKLKEMLQVQAHPFPVTNQMVVSAALQFATAAMERGERIEFIFHDARQR